MGFRGIGNVFLNLNGGLMGILFRSDICMCEICIMKKLGKESGGEQLEEGKEKEKGGKDKGKDGVRGREMQFYT